MVAVIQQEIGVLEAKAAGISVDEQKLREEAAQEWETASQTEFVQGMLQALGCTQEEYFETYQYPAALRSAYYNGLFSQLCPPENYLLESGGLDTERRNADIAARLAEIQSKYTIRIVE